MWDCSPAGSSAREYEGVGTSRSGIREQTFGTPATFATNEVNYWEEVLERSPASPHANG